MKILALDTATRTGWAFFHGADVESGVFDASIRTKATKTIPADHPGKRFTLFDNWLAGMMIQYKPDLIAYEMIVGGAFAGGNTSMIQKGLEATVLRRAMIGYANRVAIPCWSFGAGSIKKWAIGSGKLTNESKLAVCEKALQTFPDQHWETGKGDYVVDDNQADAIWIGDLANYVATAVSGTNGPDSWMTEKVLDSLTPIANRLTNRKWSKKRSR